MKVERKILHYKIEYNGNTGPYVNVEVKYREGDILITNEFQIQDVQSMADWIYLKLGLTKR